MALPIGAVGDGDQVAVADVVANAFKATGEDVWVGEEVASKPGARGWRRFACGCGSTTPGIRVAADESGRPGVDAATKLIGARFGVAA
jgi:hypothetical protein